MDLKGQKGYWFNLVIYKYENTNGEYTTPLWRGR
jgi:hypothetical protein